MKYYLVFCLVVTLMAFASPNSASGSEDTKKTSLPIPKLMRKLEATWIAQEMTQQGVPMSIRAISGSVSAANVVEYYRQQWANAGAKPLVETDAEWLIVATELDGSFISVRVKQDGHGSTGFISVSRDPAEYPYAGVTRIPIPQSFGIISHRTYVDGGVNAETITLSSKQGLGYERAAVVATLEFEGWTLVKNRRFKGAKQGFFLEFRRNRESVHVYLVTDRQWRGHTLGLVTWRETS